jgi:hypothetical protein
VSAQSAGLLADVDGLPAYDEAAVRRVEERVVISSLTLRQAYFESPHPKDLPSVEESPNGLVPLFGLGGDWSSKNGDLVCDLTFITVPEGTNGNTYSMTASYRAIYNVQGSLDDVENDLEQFVYWSALYDVWPYWREFHSSTVARSGEPAPLAPILPPGRARPKRRRKR